MEAFVYRGGRPTETLLHRMLESLYERLKGRWEERVEHRYGFWRGLVDGVVARYLDCGILDHGFARIRCPECKKELLLAFSCKGRGLCPSCGAKRAAAFAAFLRDELLADVGHTQVGVHGAQAPAPLLHAPPRAARPLVLGGVGDQDRVGLLLSWRHTGFSLHNQVTVPPGDGRAIEALARYCLRTPVSLTRLCLTADSSTVQYLAGGGHDNAPGETLDALELLARVLAHIPDPKRHLVRYYGAYSNVVRGKQKARAALAQAPTAMPAPFSAAQARAFVSSRALRGPEEWPLAPIDCRGRTSGARTRRFSPHCRPRPLPREIKLPIFHLYL